MKNLLATAAAAAEKGFFLRASRTLPSGRGAAVSERTFWPFATNAFFSSCSFFPDLKSLNRIMLSLRFCFSIFLLYHSLYVDTSASPVTRFNRIERRRRRPFLSPARFLSTEREYSTTIRLRRY